MDLSSSTLSYYINLFIWFASLVSLSSSLSVRNQFKKKKCEDDFLAYLYASFMFHDALSYYIIVLPCTCLLFSLFSILSGEPAPLLVKFIIFCYYRRVSTFIGIGSGSYTFFDFRFCLAEFAFHSCCAATRKLDICQEQLDIFSFSYTRIKL